MLHQHLYDITITSSLSPSPSSSPPPYHNSVTGIFPANDVKLKQAASSSTKEHTVQPKPLPLPPHAEIQLELQEQEMLKLERFGKILAGPTTDLGIGRNLN